MVEESTYTLQLTKVRQLLDINKDMINFHCKYTVKSTENNPFQVGVVSQSQLDNDEQVDFKMVEHNYLSEEVTFDKNIYQNFFLCLKAPLPTNVEVTLELEELPNFVDNTSPQTVDDSESISYKKIIVMVLLVALLLFLLYNLMGSNNSTEAVLPPLHSVELPKPLLSHENSILDKLKQVPLA